MTSASEVIHHYLFRFTPSPECLLDWLQGLPFLKFFTCQGKCSGLRLTFNDLKEIAQLLMLGGVQFCKSYLVSMCPGTIWSSFQRAAMSLYQITSPLET